MAKADEKLFLWINGFAGNFSPFDNAVRLIASDYLVPVTLALILVALWFTGRDGRTRMSHQVGMFVALASMALSSLSVFIVNIFYFRPRPFDALDIEPLFYRPTDSSFPSNSAAAAVAVAAAVWAVNRPVGALLIALAALYGFARVYVGVHYPLDIAAGAAIGIVVTCLTLGLKNLLQPLPTWVVKAGRILCLA